MKDPILQQNNTLYTREKRLDKKLAMRLIENFVQLIDVCKPFYPLCNIIALYTDTIQCYKKIQYRYAQAIGDTPQSL